MATEVNTTAAGSKQDLDPRELSLSEVSDDLLPAFGPIERAIILYCKIITGKTTMESIEKRYGRGNASNTSNTSKASRV